jgi:hypothetical protein
MKKLLLLVALLGMVASADDDFSATLATVAPKLTANFEEVMFKMAGGQVYLVQVKIITRTDYGTGGISYSSYQTNWARERLIAAGFTNEAGKLLLGSMELKTPKAFKTWALAECGIK